MTKAKTPDPKELVNPLRMVVALESVAASLQDETSLSEVCSSLDRISSELRQTNKWLEEIAEQQTDILLGNAYKRGPVATQPQPGERIRPKRTRFARENWFKRVFKNAQASDSEGDD